MADARSKLDILYQDALGDIDSILSRIDKLNTDIDHQTTKIEHIDLDLDKQIDFARLLIVDQVGKLVLASGTLGEAAKLIKGSTQEHKRSVENWADAQARETAADIERQALKQIENMRTLLAQEMTKAVAGALTDEKEAVLKEIGGAVSRLGEHNRIVIAATILSAFVGSTIGAALMYFQLTHPIF